MYKNSLFSPYQGFIRGNMFQNIYDGYGKLYEVSPINEQGKLLTYIDMYCFACTDLELYLDLHPDNKKALELYNEFKNEKSKLIIDYESKYASLDNSYNNQEYWNYSVTPFPWEV